MIKKIQMRRDQLSKEGVSQKKRDEGLQLTTRVIECGFTFIRLRFTEDMLSNLLCTT